MRSRRPRVNHGTIRLDGSEIARRVGHLPGAFVQARIDGPMTDLTSGSQQKAIYFGFDQDNYLKVEVEHRTSPTVGALRQNSDSVHQVEPVMAGRVEKLLAFAGAEGFEDLLLGAWGCGVFRNDPRLIARLFHDALFGEGAWATKFRRVVFAVYDPTDRGENRVPFEETFAATRGAP